MRKKLSRERIDAYRDYLKLALPASRMLAVREEIDALCDMAVEAEEMCSQLETLEGLMNVNDAKKLHEAIGRVRIMINAYRAPKVVLS